MGLLIRCELQCYMLTRLDRGRLKAFHLLATDSWWCPRLSSKTVKANILVGGVANQYVRSLKALQCLQYCCIGGLLHRSQKDACLHSLSTLEQPSALSVLLLLPTGVPVLDLMIEHLLGF